jgi:hypothetical protein
MIGQFLLEGFDLRDFLVGDAELLGDLDGLCGLCGRVLSVQRGVYYDELVFCHRDSFPLHVVSPSGCRYVAGRSASAATCRPSSRAAREPLLADISNNAQTIMVWLRQYGVVLSRE